MYYCRNNKNTVGCQGGVLVESEWDGKGESNYDEESTKGKGE